MTYFLNLFSPETWNAFRSAGSSVSGFSRHQKTQAQCTIQIGDVFLCYLVSLGRWCGALKIESNVFIDETPLFKAENDPFIIRFRVTPLAPPRMFTSRTVKASRARAAAAALLSRPQ